MDNKILKLEFDDLGFKGTSFVVEDDSTPRIITFIQDSDINNGNLISKTSSGIVKESVFDCYFMKNDDNTAFQERIKEGKERAVSCEEISRKAFEYSVKEMSERHLNFIIS